MALLTYFTKLSSILDNVIGSNVFITAKYFTYTMSITIFAWVVFTGFQYMLIQDKDKKIDLHKKGIQFCLLILFSYCGFGLVTLTEKAFRFIEMDILVMSDKVFDSDKDYSGGEHELTDAFKQFTNHPATTSIAKMSYHRSLTSAAKDEFKKLSAADCDIVSPLITQVVQEEETASDKRNPGLLQPELYKQEAEDEKSWWNTSLPELISQLIHFITALLIIIVQTIRLVFLLILKFTFPLALVLSLFPYTENSWKTWIESFMSILLWGITLSSIGMISSFFTNAIPKIGDASTWFILLIQVAIVFLVILSPTLTTMIFGASQGMNSITSTFSTQAGAFLIAGGKPVAKGAGKGLGKGITGTGKGLGKMAKKVFSKIGSK